MQNIFLHQKSAFTLVELIVTMVILSILATISFLSFFQKSSEARDTLRKTHINEIANDMNRKINIETRIVNEFIGNTSNINKFTSGNIYAESLTGSVLYDVGTINQNIFGDAMVSDPITSSGYILGYVRGEFGTYYQLAATLENGIAIINGTYYQTNGGDLPGLIRSPYTSNPILNKGNDLAY